MQTDVLVIGGGVIGVSVAYYLARQGVAVTLIERSDIAAGSSWGNAGLLCPNHSEPIPGPGVLSQGLKWLLDVESPFYTIPRPDPAPKLYVIFAERNAVTTPMGATLRFAGTLELAGMSHAINPRRVDAIRKAAREYLILPDAWGEENVWAGLRPVPPDGLPYIGRSARVKNLVVATGHAMLGLSLGPVTGKLAAELIQEQPPSLSLAGFEVERFER